MTINAHSGKTSDVALSPAQNLVVPAMGWRWRRSAVLLAIFAQLITISALAGTNSPPHTWPSILLAIAPAPLAGLAALAPPRYAPAAALTAAVVLVAAMAGALT